MTFTCVSEWTIRRGTFFVCKCVYVCAMVNELNLLQELKKKIIKKINAITSAKLAVIVGLFSLSLSCSLFFAIVLAARWALSCTSVVRLPAFEFATLFLAFSMFSLDGLLGFVLFSSSVTCFVKQKLRNFQRKKTSSTWWCWWWWLFTLFWHLHKIKGVCFVFVCLPFFRFSETRCSWLLLRV